MTAVREVGHDSPALLLICNSSFRKLPFKITGECCGLGYGIFAS